MNSNFFPWGKDYKIDLIDNICFLFVHLFILK